MTTIINAIASELESLNATHPLCVAFGDTFTATNLFLGYMQAVEYDSVALIPYGGSPPDGDGHRQNPYIQVTMRSTRQKCIEAHQLMINHLHMNELSGKGKVFAVNSAPLAVSAEEGGKWAVSTSNYSIRHVKL